MNELDVSPSIQPERYLLSAILADPVRVWQVRQTVRLNDFEHTANAHTYEAMLNVADSGRLPSVVLVASELTRLGGPHAQSVVYCYGLDDASVSGVQAGEFASIVRRHGELRKLGEVAAQIEGLATGQGSGNPIEDAAALINKMREETLSETRQIGEAFEGLVKRMRTQHPYTSTPWASLNAMIGGIRPGAMYTVAAGSGNGKSIFGLQLAEHVAELEGRVGYVSLEMDEEQLLKRMLSMMQSIHQSALNNHQLTEDGWASVMAAETALQTIKLEVWDRRPAKFADIAGWVRALHRKGDLKLIVIDYLGLLDSPDGAKPSERSAILNQYANGFKALATELDISIVVLEQLNRDSTDRKSARPVITDIRGTAALEHAADVVILLHRPKRRVGGKDVPTSFIEFIVAKNRQGEQGSRELFFDGKHARIVQAEHEAPQLVGYEDA